MRMKGKVALVTGAASGMGAATARLLAREGAKAVVLADVLDKEGEATAAEIAKAARRTMPISTSPTKVTGRRWSTGSSPSMAAWTCW